jgi:hypothetical protein
VASFVSACAVFEFRPDELKTLWRFVVNLPNPQVAILSAVLSVVALAKTEASAKADCKGA